MAFIWLAPGLAGAMAGAWVKLMASTAMVVAPPVLKAPIVGAGLKCIGCIIAMGAGLIGGILAQRLPKRLRDPDPSEHLVELQRASAGEPGEDAESWWRIELLFALPFSMMMVAAWRVYVKSGEENFRTLRVAGELQAVKSEVGDLRGEVEDVRAQRAADAKQMASMQADINGVQEAHRAHRSAASQRIEQVLTNISFLKGELKGIKQVMETEKAGAAAAEAAVTSARTAPNARPSPGSQGLAAADAAAAERFNWVELQPRGRGHWTKQAESRRRSSSVPSMRELQSAKGMSPTSVAEVCCDGADHPKESPKPKPAARPAPNSEPKARRGPIDLLARVFA